MAEQHPRPDVDNPVAGYEAEDTVNLRSQRLRRPESEPDEEPAEDTLTDATPDPYGVGQDALAAVETPDVDPAAFYRARLFDRQEEDPTAEPAEAGPRCASHQLRSGASKFGAVRRRHSPQDRASAVLIEL